MHWAYGVTTVPERRATLLPQTLHSLTLGGFDQPRLFVDGANDDAAYRGLGLPVTIRTPKLGIVGNWILALWELRVREPKAERFVLFQDDIVVSKNTRQYLETLPYPEKGYLNLYTFLENEARVPKDGVVGLFRSGQRGRGALALMFDREAVTALLTARLLVQKPLAARHPARTVDGAIVDSLTPAGWTEYLHYPCLVQHKGKHSTVGHKYASDGAKTFAGEDFDAMTLLI
jgi:hypothetical protein